MFKIFPKTCQKDLRLSLILVNLHDKACNFPECTTKTEQHKKVLNAGNNPKIGFVTCTEFDQTNIKSNFTKDPL